MQNAGSTVLEDLVLPSGAASLVGSRARMMAGEIQDACGALGADLTPNQVLGLGNEESERRLRGGLLHLRLPSWYQHLLSSRDSQSTADTLSSSSEGPFSAPTLLPLGAEGT